MSLLTLRISHGHGRGTKFFVQADPIIETFIASLGDGTTKSVQPGGFVFSDKPLEIYEVKNGEMPLPALDGIAIDAFGNPFVDGETINLSFLRLKGISQGVEFSARMLISPAKMEDLKTSIGRAIRKLCRDYILPASTKVTLVTE